MDHSGLLEALSRTPPWVYAVFLVLVVAGYSLSRDRTVGRARLMLLPAAMCGISLYGVGSSFGFDAFAFAAWTFGFSAVVACVPRLKTPKGVEPLPDSDSFRVPGSWLPFGLMMSVFSIRYTVGYATARGLWFAQHPGFVVGCSVALGVLSGVFTARAAVVWRSGLARQSAADT